jgi:hypothetical protein
MSQSRSFSGVPIVALHTTRLLLRNAQGVQSSQPDYRMLRYRVSWEVSVSLHSNSLYKLRTAYPAHPHLRIQKNTKLPDLTPQGLDFSTFYTVSIAVSTYDIFL